MAAPAVGAPVVVDEPGPATPLLRVLQALAALAGAVLFITGIVAAFRVDLDGGFLDTTGTVAGLGFSPALALAAILLGGACLLATVADEDRSGAAVVGLITLVAGIGVLVLADEPDVAAGTDRDAALLFVVVGTVVFLLSLVPWWTVRRRVRR